MSKEFMAKASDILKDRKSQYGSYLDNMKHIYKLLPKIDIKVEFVDDQWSEDYISKFASQVVTFAKNMLALKAARSYSAKDDAYQDCLYDFVNYHNLTISALYELGYRAEIVYDDTIFNTHLNDRNEFGYLLEAVNYLVDPDVKSFWVLPNNN